MNILEMCDAGGATVPVEATAEQAIRTMLDRHVGAVAVLDDNQRIAGIFTEREGGLPLPVSGRERGQTPIREVMTTPVEMATLDTTPGQALGTMIERHYRHLPIVEDDGRLVGMISIRNVLHARIDALTRQLDEARLVRSAR